MMHPLTLRTVPLDRFGKLSGLLAPAGAPRARKALASLATLTLVAGVVTGCGGTADKRAPAAPKPAGQRTVQATYSPFERDGSVRRQLTATGSAQVADVVNFAAD